MNYVITIGRQFGSGGREIGRKIAQSLGIPFYDKELLAEAARASGVDAGFFERSDERFPSLTSGGFSFNMGMSALPWYTPSSISDEAIYRDLSNIIKEVARRSSCVIVGRSADHILRDQTIARTVNIFIHSPLDDRIRRIIARGDAATETQARTLAEKQNRMRANYYNFYTDKRWGDAATYDLTLDTSLLSHEAIVEFIRTYLHHRGCL